MGTAQTKKKGKATQKRPARSPVFGIPLDEVLREEMKDPTFRAAFEVRGRIHEIALAVRSLRERAGLSQEELAVLAGMKRSAIARLETSQEHLPRIDLLSRIVQAMGKRLRLTIDDPDRARDFIHARSHLVVRV